jgi:hypothetical protein
MGQAAKCFQLEDQILLSNIHRKHYAFCSFKVCSTTYEGLGTWIIFRLFNDAVSAVRWYGTEWDRKLKIINATKNL